MNDKDELPRNLKKTRNPQPSSNRLKVSAWSSALMSKSSRKCEDPFWSLPEWEENEFDQWQCLTISPATILLVSWCFICVQFWPSSRTSMHFEKSEGSGQTWSGADLWALLWSRLPAMAWSLSIMIYHFFSGSSFSRGFLAQTRRLYLWISRWELWVPRCILKIRGGRPDGGKKSGDRQGCRCHWFKARFFAVILQLLAAAH